MNYKPTNTENIAGSIERITFHNEENGFCVLKVKVRAKRELVTVIGSAACVSAGEYVECRGIWVNDKSHGVQFKAENLQIVPPTTLEGIEKYLGSGMIKGIGPHFAKTLIKAFGENVFSIIENESHRLINIEGIGKKRKDIITKAWQEQKIVRNIMVFLQSHGIGTARAVRIYKTYGDNAIDVVRDNPYRLALDIIGIGFKTADALAMQLGISKDSIKRAQAGIRHVIQEFSSEGHCAIQKDNLIKISIELLEIPKDIIINAIVEEIKTENIVLEKIDDIDCLFLKALHQAETFSAKNISNLKIGKPPWGEIECEKAIDWAQKKTNITLSASQYKAVELALTQKIVVITGGPGVGKTTIINTILKIVHAKNTKVSLCAPTGRAAKRLTETTGFNAKTIHRLLEFDPKIHSFKYNQNNKLDTDMVIIDEASMIDIVLWHNIIRSIPMHASLLIVGDIDQLPSVGPGSVLADVIDSQAVTVIRLNEIFRQANDSQIIANAHRINQGQSIISNSNKLELNDFYFIQANTPEEIQQKLVQVVTQNIPKRFKFDPKKDIQVLAPMNRGGLGSRSLNIILQEKLNSNSIPKINKFGTSFAPGDKIIQCVNNYDKDVFNGDIGIIDSIDIEKSEAKINFDERLVIYDFNEFDEISLAYATSIHKSQGSEYPVVVIPISIQHYMMLARNLLYTAVTRGKKLVIIIGQAKAVAMAIKNVKVSARLTNLKFKLNQFM